MGQSYGESYGEGYGAVLWGGAMGQSSGVGLWGGAMGRCYGAVLWGGAMGQGCGSDGCSQLPGAVEAQLSSGGTFRPGTPSLNPYRYGAAP